MSYCSCCPHPIRYLVRFSTLLFCFRLYFQLVYCVSAFPFHAMHAGSFRLDPLAAMVPLACFGSCSNFGLVLLNVERHAVSRGFYVRIYQKLSKAIYPRLSKTCSDQYHLFRPPANLGHQQPAYPLSPKKCDHRGLDDPNALLRAHDTDHERPERTPALTHGAHERECICVHASRDEPSTSGDGCGVEGRDGDADESSTDCSRCEVWEEPCEALETDGEAEVDDDGTPFAEEHIERWEEDTAQSDACRRDFRLVSGPTSNK